MRNEQTAEKMLEQLRNKPNSMSYWLPKFENKGLNIPETVIIPLSQQWFEWLMSDNYEQEKINEFTEWINERLEEREFDTNRELFIKTGTFSNKFVFQFPHVIDTKKIGQQYLDVFYGGMCVGCEPCPEICVREFIHTSYERESIYHGMKLNTEFRMFYDFDKKKILDIFNYWDRETMQKSLSKDDLEGFLKSIADIECDYIYLKPILTDLVEDSIQSVDLNGIWSIDFMWDGEKFWFIDAAIGRQSYYFDRLKLQDKK